MIKQVPGSTISLELIFCFVIIKFTHENDIVLSFSDKFFACSWKLTPVILALRRLTEKNHCEPEDSMGYTVISRPAGLQSDILLCFVFELFFFQEMQV